MKDKKLDLKNIDIILSSLIVILLGIDFTIKIKNNIFYWGIIILIILKIIVSIFEIRKKNKDKSFWEIIQLNKFNIFIFLMILILIILKIFQIK